MLTDAAWYIRYAAVYEPNEDCEDDNGHHLADRLFDFLGIDRTGPKHAHDRDPM